MNKTAKPVPAPKPELWVKSAMSKTPKWYADFGFSAVLHTYIGSDGDLFVTCREFGLDCVPCGKIADPEAAKALAVVLICGAAREAKVRAERAIAVCEAAVEATNAKA